MSSEQQVSQQLEALQLSEAGAEQAEVSQQKADTTTPQQPEATKQSEANTTQQQSEDTKQTEATQQTEDTKQAEQETQDNKPAPDKPKRKAPVKPQAQKKDGNSGAGMDIAAPLKKAAGVAKKPPATKYVPTPNISDRVTLRSE